MDLAKRVMQVHAVDAAGRVVMARALARDQFKAWCVRLPPGCLIAMEACGGAHHWARRLQGPGFVAQRLAALRLALPDALEDASNELPGLARMALQRAQLQWAELDCHIAWCDERIAAHVRSDEQARTAAQLCGIGPVTASALVASVDDFKQSKLSGRRQAARSGAC